MGCNQTEGFLQPALHPLIGMCVRPDSGTRVRSVLSRWGVRVESDHAHRDAAKRTPKADRQHEDVVAQRRGEKAAPSRAMSTASAADRRAKDTASSPALVRRVTGPPLWPTRLLVSRPG